MGCSSSETLTYRATYIVSHVALASTSESLDSKYLALFHLCLIRTLHNGHTLATVDNVLVDVVAVQVSDTLNGVHCSIQLHFIAFHGLLDGSTNVADADINSGFL